MAKTRKSAEAVEDTFQDLDVTLNDGLEVVEEIEASQDEEEIIEEVVVEEPAPAVQEAPKSKGVYYKGELITKIPARLGSKWTIIYQGRRLKVRKDELEIIN